MTTDIEFSARETAFEPTRLMAIVIADMVGSTRLSYEAGELALHRGTDQLLARTSYLLDIHAGQMIKSTGDGFVAVFETVLDATEVAIELLRTLDRNPVFVGNEKIILRTSLHTGMVQLRQTSYGLDVFGEAVLVAAHLNTRAPAGELIVSEAAFTALPSSLQASFRSIGMLRLKGVATDMQAYTLAISGE